MARSVDIAARSSRKKHLTGQRKAGIGTLLGQVVESLMSADIERSSAERRHHPAKTRSSDPYSSKYNAMPITVEDRYFDVWNTKTEAETAHLICRNGKSTNSSEVRRASHRAAAHGIVLHHLAGVGHPSFQRRQRQWGQVYTVAS